MEFTPELIWFLVGLGLILAEFMLPGIILVFFGAGAWIAALTTWIGLTGGWPGQLLVFAFSSVILLIILRRRIRTRFFGHVRDDLDPDVNLDEFAGQTVTVLAAISADEPGGRVEYKGATWSAMAPVDIAAGQQAIIQSIDGLTLQVTPVSHSAPSSSGPGPASDPEGEE